jgi:hypothetical protein
MNERIRELAEQARESATTRHPVSNITLSMNSDLFEQKFAELIIEAVLDQVKERAYYTGDRDWSDEVDRPWIQLEFGYGALAK